MKKVVAIHDISGFGKCSLTVALPIISAVGVEAVALPTAVLSTHTGGIEGYTYHDLTEDMPAIAAHWKSLNLQFDAIYTGFLGSIKQVDIVKDFISSFKRGDDTLVLVDPVMADHGKLYSIFDEAFVVEMRKLCSYADILVPNLTEACFLLDEPYTEGPYTPEYIEGIVRRLSQLGPKQIVLTGVYFNQEELGAASYNRATASVSYSFSARIPDFYHGTGDVFGSALIGVLMNGFSLEEAVDIAVAFTTDSIAHTAAAKTDLRFGVHFEKSIPLLLRKTQLI